MSRTWWLGLGVAVNLVALTGCEVSVGDCDKDDGGSCIDEFPRFDGGLGMDATTDGSATPNDGGGSTDGGGGPDGAVTGPALTVAQFCRAQLETAVKWRDLFDSAGCSCLQDTKVQNFLSGSLAYGGEDPEGSCITARNASIAASRVQFVGTNAAACATKFASQFEGPPTMCPVDIAVREAMVGHGVQPLSKLAECRSAFVGKVKRDGVCSHSASGAGDSLECEAGLRCLPVLGSGGGGVPDTTCQPARAAQETCARSADCADGLICAGGSVSRVCIPSNALRANNGECALSVECITGLVCRNNTCVTPTADSVCGM